MKKMVSVLAVAICLIMALPSQAQIRFGVKGGVNISKVTFSGDMFRGDNRTGFYIGPTAEFTIPMLGLGIDASALYNQTEARSEGMGSNLSEASEKMRSIELPVNLKWSVGMGSALGVFVAAGPQFGFNMGDDNYAHIFKMSNCYTSFNVGGGLKLFRHIQAGVNYNFGISRLAKTTDVYEGMASNMRRKTWQFSLAYMF